MALWSDSCENDPLYSPLSSTHQAAINPRPGYQNMSYEKRPSSNQGSKLPLESTLEGDNPLKKNFFYDHNINFLRLKYIRNAIETTICT